MAEKRPKPRLTHPDPDNLSEAQKVLRDAIASGPRANFMMRGPFAIWMDAPDFGMLAQRLGGYVRFKTKVPPRLSEFAILCTARQWRAQFEWEAHAPIAEKAGVKPKTIRALQTGRRPAGAPADELAIYDFVQQLYRDRRVEDRLYKRVQKLFGNEGLIEFVGILGYYAMISMMLNVFRAATDPAKPLPFREPAL
ncbi:MAG: carboxymuconolactone decarboxylase family protein [Variibacter sp.]